MFKVAQLSFNKPKPLCRISTLTYEHTQRNITALTPDIYCWSGRFAPAPMEKLCPVGCCPGAKRLSNPHWNGRYK